MDFVGTVPLKARVFRRFVCLAPEAAGLAQCLGEHINNILKDGELEREVVCAKFAHTTIHDAACPTLSNSSPRHKIRRAAASALATTATLYPNPMGKHDVDNVVKSCASRASVPSISSVRLNMAGCFIRGKVYQIPRARIWTKTLGAARNPICGDL